MTQRDKGARGCGWSILGYGDVKIWQQPTRGCHHERRQIREEDRTKSSEKRIQCLIQSDSSRRNEYLQFYAEEAYSGSRWYPDEIYRTNSWGNPFNLFGTPHLQGPLTHAGYPRAPASVASTLASVASLLHPLFLGDHSSSSGTDLSMSFLPLSTKNSNLRLPEYSTKHSDDALATRVTKLEASQFWEGQIRVTIQDGSLWCLFKNKGSLYHSGSKCWRCWTSIVARIHHKPKYGDP